MGRARVALAPVLLGLGAAAAVLPGVLGARAQPRPTAGTAAGTEATTEARTETRCQRARAGAAASCGACHSAIHEQWRRSAHAAAFDDPLFRAEYEPSPSTFCSDCHASGEAHHDHDPHDGVDCSSCHPPTAQAAEADGVTMCTACHQFQFPADPLGHRGHYDPADPLQDTVAEWRRSRAAVRGQTCVDCHMPATPAGDGPRSHRLRDTHDPELLARALTVRARAQRAPEGVVVELRLSAGQVGHRVPTGDMFRRLRVSAWVEGRPADHRWLGRSFAQAPASDDQGFRLRPVLDDRVPAPGEGEPLAVR
ncbi:MAG: hypothetical protein KDK70_39865, partial [Myxococcales bacterium]|nr:hypothetical protein [Myxococcales bacterium]